MFNVLSFIHFRTIKNSLPHLKTNEEGSMIPELYGLTSPAPRNKNLWSAKFPPTNFRAATSPARTTDAVPWNKVDTISGLASSIVTKVPEFIIEDGNSLPEYHH